MAYFHGHRRDAVIDIIKATNNFTGGLEFIDLTYTVTKKLKNQGKWESQEVNLLNRITGYAPKGSVTAVMGPSGAGKSTFLDGLAGRIASGSLMGMVSLDGKEISPSLIKRTSAYIMQDDRLFPMLTVYETLMFAADFRLGSISNADKRQRVDTLIDQLGLSTSKNTYIGDEETRGISGGERRRVSIGVDIIHGPSLLFLDEPTSGLDSTSAHSVIEKVHNIARAGSTVILTIHQPSSRIQQLLDHIIILAKGQLMYQGAPNEVETHLNKMGHKVPNGENSIEFLIDVIQEYDKCELGVGVLAEFAVTGMKPPPLSAGNEDVSGSTVAGTPSPVLKVQSLKLGNEKELVKRLPLDGGSVNRYTDFDHSLRSPWSSSKSWSAGNSGVVELLRLTPKQKINRLKNTPSPSSYYGHSKDFIPPGTPTSINSERTLSEGDFQAPYTTPLTNSAINNFHQKFPNSFLSETWILMRRNFKNIRRTPELFLSRLMVLTIMGFMMSTMFLKPKSDIQGITNRLSFFIFTVCLFFFSSNDAVPAFIQERFIFIRETSHNAYRASSYTIAGQITYLPFLALQSGVYSAIVWFPLRLRGSFLYFFIVLYASLLSTNSFVVFVSCVVPSYILGYAAVIAFTALFFLFCGYFVTSNNIPPYWKWMNTLSTMTYPYEGLLMNQYQTDEVFGNDANGREVRGNDILNGFDISNEGKKKWENVLIMLGWAVLYRVTFYVVLRFFSKNQRR